MIHDQTPDLTPLAGIDWDQPGSILEGCTLFFDTATSDRYLLPTMLDRLAGDAHLREMCERYDFLDKLVIADLPDQGVRIRLHLYRSGYFDRPHNHRWSFASHIVRGQYRHRIFGADDTFTEDTDTSNLVPIHERIERVGDQYALHHTSVHTVQAEADTISLLVRGPATKDRFLIIDRHNGGFFWVHGAANETPAQRAAKQMTPPQLADTLGRVRDLLNPREVRV